jgi:hypothetical protein
VTLTSYSILDNAPTTTMVGSALVNLLLKPIKQFHWKHESF